MRRRGEGGPWQNADVLKIQIFTKIFEVRGGKALTMIMTPWNLPHGHWSKKLTMTITPSILPMVNGQIDQF